MNYQRTDAPNGNALEDFEVAEVHYGAGPLFPGQTEDWQRSQPEPLGYLRAALKNLFGPRWWRRLRMTTN